MPAIGWSSEYSVGPRDATINHNLNGHSFPMVATDQGDTPTRAQFPENLSIDGSVMRTIIANVLVTSGPIER